MPVNLSKVRGDLQGFGGDFAVGVPHGDGVEIVWIAVDGHGRRLPRRSIRSTGNDPSKIIVFSILTVSTPRDAGDL
jgi:hypothetical protein